MRRLAGSLLLLALAACGDAADEGPLEIPRGRPLRSAPANQDELAQASNASQPPDREPAEERPAAEAPARATPSTTAAEEPVEARGPEAPGQPGQTGQTGRSATPVADEGEYEEIDFLDIVSFEYDEPDLEALSAEDLADTLEERVPDYVLDWAGESISIFGYMNPLEFDGDGVSVFTLTPFPGGCCFAIDPKVNDWIMVRMPNGERAPYLYHEGLTIEGELQISEEIADGAVQSLFRVVLDRYEVE